MKMRQLLQPLSSLRDRNVPAQRIVNISVLDERERFRILYEWNDTRAEYPDACVHELFEQQVARDPDAVAVVFKGRQMSYRELNWRANQVAHYLRKRGVGPEILVGVCFEHSPEMVIALLGVWKSGGAYVPLDPAYPPERLSFMVSDARVKVLVTDEKCKNLLPSNNDRAVCLDSDWTVIAQESGGNLTAAAIPSNLAYVMYTSGSTGQPKGAMIQHSGLVNYLCWAIKAYAVEAGCSVPVHTSISFDLTVTSLYPALLTGGRVELLPEDVGMQSLTQAVRDGKNRSLVKITPSHLELLSRQLSPDEMAGITKTFVIGGENLPAERLSPWRNFAPATRLINEYGPTETVVGCCVYEVQAEDPGDGSVPIGRPIANTQLYVLDPNFEPVPVGVVGELYIGGAGVARGYLNRPELTRERFLADPFSGQRGARFYKTGDLARYRDDGTLECLGRVDDQVKVRGYRIELGEIEATLAGHSGVESCVVLAREDTPGDLHLVGYVAARESESLGAGELQNFLRQKLPDYMVPAHFVFLDSFPLTKNGKIDRKTLPAMSYENAAKQEFVAPRNEIETKLSAILIKLLNVTRIGIHDDFFELGGHSFLAIKALSQIRAAFEVNLPIESFYKDATIAALASALAGREKSRNRLTYAVPIQYGGEKPIFFYLGPGNKLRPLWLRLGLDHPLFSIGMDPRAVEQLKAPYDMEELVRHLISAIREKQPLGPYYLGGFCRDGVFAYEVARQLTIQGQDVGLLVLFEPFYPFQSTAVRFATWLKRMIIRIGFRFGELRRLGVKQIPLYARSRWRNLKVMATDLSWRISALFRSLSSRSHSPDLEQILFLAASSYKAKPLGCPTIIFRCIGSPTMSAGDPYFGWREFLTGPSESHMVPGDHAGMFREPNVKVLAEKLRTCLKKERINEGKHTNKATA
jgi:amino acid adenylation domain-containing protein